LVRQTAQDQHKQVRLDIAGGTVEADRGVLDRLMPVLDHLLRNAVAHGIETPEARVAAGKPPEGVVTLVVGQTGNDLELVLSDDGAGLNHGAIQARAQALGWLQPGEAMDTEQATHFIFEPGFSTASTVDEVAGRGIGLDVARNEVLALGGRIDGQPGVGGGTRFRLVVPLSTAVTQVLMLRVGDFTFGVPAPWVSAVHRVQATDLTQAYLTGAWSELGQTVPFFWAGALLALSPESTDAASQAARQWPVLVFHSAGQHVAWHVDEVLGPQEVVVKPLGPQLARLPGLAGATVLPSGSVGLIYNPVALAALFGTVARDWVRRQRQGALGQPASTPSTGVGAPAGLGAGKAPLVLVVDDSITVRRVTQRLLQREGYRVALAADGVQALERVREERPAVVLCDIEMPRMDGFEFLRQLRATADLADLPVVMITSRIADKHRDHARALGVDHYLGKPYAEDTLLGLVAGYVRLGT
jgi:chemosensory pili system protein ChpA (sensor histidine kinase/response regulator)